MTDPIDVPGLTPGSGDLAVVTLLLQQMAKLEERLGVKIDRIESSASGQWGRHEDEHTELAKAVRAIGHRLDDHLAKEATDALVFDARVGPIRRAATWCFREWRTVAVVALVVIDLVGRVTEQLRGVAT